MSKLTPHQKAALHNIRLNIIHEFGIDEMVEQETVILDATESVWEMGGLSKRMNAAVEMAIRATFHRAYRIGYRQGMKAATQRKAQR